MESSGIHDRVRTATSTVEMGATIREAFGINAIDAGELIKAMNDDPTLVRQVAQLLLIERLSQPPA